MSSEKRFGAWTGKTPLTLLNETCSKHRWKYNITTVKKKVWASEISIFQGSKTLKYSHSIEAADAQDARHFAATYALFQIAGHLSMRNLLPPDHSAYWKELQTNSVNSFTVSKEPNEFNALKGSNTSLVSSSNSINSNSAGKSPLPSIFLDQEIRSEVESLIRGMNVFKKQDIKLDLKYQNMLVKSGFRRVHVEEAANYTLDFQDAIHWLCIHVPEDGMLFFFYGRSPSKVFAPSIKEDYHSFS